jgi:urea carboxylase
VGIGGAYLCVYGMEGPGGYQFVGRTLQMWNRYRQTEAFRDGKRWLLRFFDQLRFHPVSAEELERLRVEFPYGKAQIDIEPTTLRLRDYRRFLQDNAESISAFKARQQAAFDAERERWRAEPTEPDPPATAGGALAATGEASFEPPAGSIAISSPVTGSVWQLKSAAGERVAAGDTLLIIEAMKMEVAVNAEQAGTIVELRCQRGQAVAAGETLLWLHTDEEHSA